ncbi:hypothetical protein AAG570_013060 [Ranatra chinensis]|uniref:Dynein heavy chain coiled coil stalk domain-containing protein n=1 Tax=Ranatra chinensis TaxID=642074 RepID=A0ABD0YS54_9HEMI
MKSKKVLDQISFTLANANTRKNEMEELRVRTENQNVALKTRKIEIDKELSEIEPLVQEARAAVGNIKSESLSEIRSLRIPPQVIRDILEGVLRLMGIKDTCFNASLISDDDRNAVENLLAIQKHSFDHQNAKRASLAAAPLAAWVKANVKYSYVLKNIKPLEEEQSRLTK